MLQLAVTYKLQPYTWSDGTAGSAATWSWAASSTVIVTPAHHLSSSATLIKRSDLLALTPWK
jgi:hypothetical protein